MNNENKARIRIVWTMVFTAIVGLLFGVDSSAQAQMKESMSYSKSILYVNKYVNIVNVKEAISLDVANGANKIKNSLYLINDLQARNTFLMPAYSKKLNLRSRVDKRVIISRLANGLKSTETGGVGSYTRKSYSSSACGAYQYMPETWNNYMGYKSACLAPAWVQDMRVIHELEYNYIRFGDWRKVVAAHLMPSRANDPRTWNKRVPGNPTVQEYVNSVFKKANIALA
jgi:hypothetical protein